MAGILTLGCFYCCSIFSVEPVTAKIFEAFGKIVRVEKTQGLHM